MGSGEERGSGTREQPWRLTTPSGSGTYEMYRDEAADPPALVCQVGKTQLRYQLRCVDDLHAMLKAARRLDAARQRRRAEAGGRRHRRGVGRARRTTRSAAGTACARASAAGSACTCRRCWRRSAWPRSSTTHATTGCGPLELIGLEALFGVHTFRTGVDNRSHRLEKLWITGLAWRTSGWHADGVRRGSWLTGDDINGRRGSFGTFACPEHRNRRASQSHDGG